jgi:hypothetical protein
MIGFNKLECYIISIGWTGLPGTNTRAYWAHSYVMKKMKNCEDESRAVFLVVCDPSMNELIHRRVTHN